RQTAVELENILHKYRQAIDRYIKEKCSVYTKKTIETKENIFTGFYHESRKKEKVEPKSHVNLDVNRQHFEDMMKQFNNVHRQDADSKKDNTEVVKLKKYLDNPNPVIAVEPVKKDRQPTTSSSHFHLIDQENLEDILGTIEYRRSRASDPRYTCLCDPLHDQYVFHMPDRFRAV
ncbi:unnamed protein product, partial [Rotaria sp. Silwood1]